VEILVVVPFLNEERFIGTFLGSLADQTRVPDRLLLVDDGSTDGSSEIAEAFAREHAFAEVARRPPRDPGADRLAGGSAVRAFEWGLAEAAGTWDVAVKMDADLRLTPDLFAELEKRFAEDPGLGMAGPYLGVLQDDGSMVRQRCPADHVEGPAKFYRRACWEDIAPLPPILAGTRSTRSAADARVAYAELRDAGRRSRAHAADGLARRQLRGFRRWGTCAYGYGEHPCTSCWSPPEVARRPRVLGGLNYVLGFAVAAVQRSRARRPSCGRTSGATSCAASPEGPAPPEA
jgi:hypothetical protein